MLVLVFFDCNSSVELVVAIIRFRHLLDSDSGVFADEEELDTRKDFSASTLCALFS